MKFRRKEICAIFTEVSRNVFDRALAAYTYIKAMSRKSKTAVFAGVAAIAILLSLFCTGARIAYNVNYDGKVIASISDKKHYDAAVQLILQMVGTDTQDVLSNHSFSLALSTNKAVSGAEELAKAIIDNTDEIVCAATLTVNGESVACVDECELKVCLDNHKKSFSVAGAECTNEFVDDVKIESGYYLATDVQDVSEVYDVVKTLSVKTQLRTVTDVNIAYSTVTQKTAEQVVGYTKVTTKGVEGVTRVTEDVVLVNGNVESRTQVSAEVLSNPVDEIVVVGTARSAAAAEQQKIAKSAGFIFPLPAGTWRVSSYYGDGRNHKGIDICAPKNTAIMAVADGTVTYAGWRNDFGYNIIIDHGNGISTRYAHANKLCVTAGQTVSAGETIALVGTTGYSSGNHLHFETIVGSTRVNPAPYIGL